MTAFVIIYSINYYTTIYSTCNKVVLIAFSISDFFVVIIYVIFHVTSMTM